MSDLLDKSLDQIIASRGSEGGKSGRGGKRGGRGGRGGGAPREPKESGGGGPDRVITVIKRAAQESSGPARRGAGDRGRRQQEAAPFKRETAGDVDGEWEHDLYSGGRPRPRGLAAGRAAPAAAPAAAPRAPISLGAKVLVTNLDKGIGADDLREIFARVGVVKSVAIHYADDGSSKGVADVVYRNRSAADAAVAEFDGRQVDDTVIRVRIVGEGAAPPPQPAAPAAGFARPGPGGVHAAGGAAGAPERRGRGLFDHSPAAAAAAFSAPPPRAELQFSLGHDGSRHVGAAVESRGHFRGGRGGGRGRGGFRGGGRGGFLGRSSSGRVTDASDLDAAMEAYKSAAGR